MTAQPARTNGDVPHTSTEKSTPSTSTPPRVVLAGKTGRILCVADIRGDYHELNRLIREHEATAVIHTGDFGFMNTDSVERMGDKILRHLITYSPLIPPATRTQLLSIPTTKDNESDRKGLIEQLNNSSVHFPLSQFPHLLSGAINFPVPVFTVWGLIEDVRVLEKFRTGEYEVNNLHIIDEATSKVVDVGGLKLRLLGLGGAVTPHKMFDNGEGYATIAGGSGTMWATALQMGELIDTAHRVYDASETRLFISSAPIRNGLISLISNALKADLTISGGLHFRYPVSFNEFSIHEKYEQYQQKLVTASSHFTEVYDAVREKVNDSMNEPQQALLKKILSAVTKIPQEGDHTWTNTWNWILSDASCGHMILSVTDSRVSAETKTAGLNFSHRTGQGPSLPSAPVPTSIITRRPETSEAPKTVAPTRAPIGPGSAAATKPGQTSGAPPTGPNAFRNGLNRPNPAKPAGPVAPLATTASPAPVAPSSSTTNGTASIPVKPPTQPRGGRGSNIAGQAFAAASAVKDKIVEAVKPGATSTAKPTPPGPAKPSTPATNAKPNLTPAASSDKIAKDESKKTTTPPTNGASTNGAASEVGNTSTESKDITKPAHSREGSGEVRPKKHSLYLKGLPIPTTEEEIKGLFKDQAGKIAQVKIISDRLSNKQKDFGYVDFANEEDMIAALKAAEGGKLKDSVISISVSNPPARVFPDGSGFRGRGGRGGISGFRGSRGRGFGSISGGIGRKEGGDAKEGGSGSGEKKE